MEDTERLRIVLKHLIEHNEGHAEDYKRWIDLANNAGMNAVGSERSRGKGKRGPQEGPRSY